MLPLICRYHSDAAPTRDADDISSFFTFMLFLRAITDFMLPMPFFAITRLIRYCCW